MCVSAMPLRLLRREELKLVLNSNQHECSASTQQLPLVVLQYSPSAHAHVANSLVPLAPVLGSVA